MSETEGATTVEEFGFGSVAAEEAEILPTAVGWPRILARGVDMLFVYLLFTFAFFALFGFVLGIIGRMDLAQAILGTHWLVLVIVPLVIWGLGESLLVSTIGATPGKLLLGLRVVDGEEGAYPGLGKSLGRTFWLLVRGLLLGIPVLTKLAMFYWCSALMPPYKAPPWDKRAGTRVAVRRKAGKPAMALAAVLIAAGTAWTVFALLSRLG